MNEPVLASILSQRSAVSGSSAAVCVCVCVRVGVGAGIGVLCHMETRDVGVDDAAGRSIGLLVSCVV